MHRATAHTEVRARDRRRSGVSTVSATVNQPVALTRTAVADARAQAVARAAAVKRAGG